MLVVGYKCFNKGLVNRYGRQFEVGVTYHCIKNIKFGDNGHGFHICTNLEDTLRFFDGMNEEMDIAEVVCDGNYEKYDDEYNDFYGMYAFEYMFIRKVLTRQEIIDYALNLYGSRIKRFISLFKLTREEIRLFKEKFKKEEIVLDYISYYQENDKDVFERRLKK